MIGTIHPHIIPMAVTKGTLREQSAEEGGEARMTLNSVRKAESSDVGMAWRLTF